MLDLQFVRAASLKGYTELVGQLGGNADALLRQAHIQPNQIADDEQLIPAQSMCDILEISADALACPDFALRLSQLQGVAMLGLVGLVIQHARTVGEALQLLQRYLHIHSQVGSFSITFEHGLAQLNYAPHYDYRGRSQQLIDLALGVGMNILSMFTDKNFRATSIYFSYQMPADLSRYHQIFRVPMVFNSEHNQVLLEQKMLALPVHSDRAEFSSMIDAYLTRLEKTAPTRLEDKVALLIRQQILSGHCDLNSTAHLLDVHPRTLQRRLAQNGTRFQSLLDQIRKQLAIRYLQETEISITHLSQMLGFAEVSVFSRVFKGWLGMSPTQFIIQQGYRMRVR